MIGDIISIRSRRQLLIDTRHTCSILSLIHSPTNIHGDHTDEVPPAVNIIFEWMQTWDFQRKWVLFYNDLIRVICCWLWEFLFCFTDIVRFILIHDIVVCVCNMSEHQLLTIFSSSFPPTLISNYTIIVFSWQIQFLHLWPPSIPGINRIMLVWEQCLLLSSSPCNY